MAEPDHIFVNPLPNLASETQPAGYPFFYIKPAQNEKVIRKFYPKEKGPVTDVDPIGNSPVIIQKVNFQLIIASIRFLIAVTFTDNVITYVALTLPIEDISGVRSSDTDIGTDTAIISIFQIKTDV